MISPTDTAYRLLPTSPSARELMDAYTPGLFELKFAEERTKRDQFANPLEDMFDFDEAPSLGITLTQAAPPTVDCTPK
jgi:hypothetical protein